MPVKRALLYFVYSNDRMANAPTCTFNLFHMFLKYRSKRVRKYRLAVTLQSLVVITYSCIVIIHFSSLLSTEYKKTAVDSEIFSKNA